MNDQPQWRALTDPPMICSDIVKQKYDATTGKKFPVEWVRLEPQQEVNVENLL